MLPPFSKDIRFSLCFHLKSELSKIPLTIVLQLIFSCVLSNFSVTRGLQAVSKRIHFNAVWPLQLRVTSGLLFLLKTEKLQGIVHCNNLNIAGDFLYLVLKATRGHLGDLGALGSWLRESLFFLFEIMSSGSFVAHISFVLMTAGLINSFLVQADSGNTTSFTG